MADASKRKPREPARYVRNQIFQSVLDKRWFFVPRAVDLGGGVCRAVGKRYDITDSMRAILKKAKSPRRAKKAAKRRKKKVS